MSLNGAPRKRFLSAEQKYDLWVRMLTGQLTTVQAAAEAGVDRTTIATLKRVARDGAIAALEASKPGRRQHSAGESAELARLRGEVDRLSRGRSSSRPSSWPRCGEKRPGDERSGPCPCRRGRQGGAARRHRRCGRRRVGRCRGSAACWSSTGNAPGAGSVAACAGRLDDEAPGGNPIHGILAWEERRWWSCSRSGDRSICRTASSPTAAPTWSGCGCRRRRWTASWPATASP